MKRRFMIKMNKWYPELTARAASWFRCQVDETGYMHDDLWPYEERQNMIARNLSRAVFGAFAREYSDMRSAVVTGSILENMRVNAPAMAAECIKLPLDSESIIVMTPDKSLITVFGERSNLPRYERYYRAQMSVNFRTNDPPTMIVTPKVAEDLLAGMLQNSLVQGTEITCQSWGLRIFSGWFDLRMRCNTNVADEIDSVSWKEKFPGVFQQNHYGWKNTITLRGLAGTFGFEDPRKVAKWNDEVLRVFDIIAAAKNILPQPIFEAFFEFFW